jgi:hypothetical protein
MPVNRLISSGKRMSFRAAFDTASRLSIHYACNLTSLTTAVRAAHGVLIFTDGEPERDQVSLMNLARLFEKPLLCVDIADASNEALSLRILEWRLRNDIRGLFVDGPEAVDPEERLPTILTDALSKRAADVFRSDRTF